ISKYHVGAVGIGSSGRIFFGANLEFPGLPLNHSVHAEQFLITNLSLNAEPRLKYIAVSAAPCGHCRQFFQELRGAPDVKMLITSSDDEKENKISNTCNDKDQEFTPLSHFLPHSGCPSGVALIDVEGKIYKGSYMESAAYNPSLPPVQAAIVAYVASGGGGGYERIVRAVLVEKSDAVIKQEHTARLLLQCISPKCEVKVFSV
ncbi:hypothetical protein Godav_012757, partial [Gossypium davidsonii]|nr:hypothetical protein [Gossypium davidsonii]